MELTISYSQLMLMNYDGDQPYVDWTDEDFERGYAKTDGTVIFEALSDYACEVKVTPGKHIEKEEVIRTVTVPFTVENECIVVTSILSNKFQIPIPNGEYTVVLQATPLEEPTDDELYKIQYEFFLKVKNKNGVSSKRIPHFYYAFVFSKERASFAACTMCSKAGITSSVLLVLNHNQD